jgi:uncharacterized protein YbcI
LSPAAHLAHRPDALLTGIGELRDAISNHIVRVYADAIGRGPTKVRTDLCEHACTCLLEDTLIPLEHTLVREVGAAAVSETRAQLRGALRERLLAGVEEISGRRVRVAIAGAEIGADLVAWAFVFER